MSRKFMIAAATRDGKALSFDKSKIFKGKSPGSAAKKAALYANKSNPRKIKISIKEVTGASGKPVLTSANVEKLYNYFATVKHNPTTISYTDKTGKTNTITRKYQTVLQSIRA